jgi:hypothetical protein
VIVLFPEDGDSLPLKQREPKKEAREPDPFLHITKREEKRKEIWSSYYFFLLTLTHLFHKQTADDFSWESSS